jgi:hypothetical protein
VAVLEIYSTKLMAQLAWVLILLGALSLLRRRGGWTALTQFLGAAAMVLWIFLDWILWDPRLGRFDPTDLELVELWSRLQGWVIGVAVLVFAVGYLASPRGAKAEKRG